MLNIFRKSLPAVLGIDISKSAVKIIELRRSGSSYRVESFAVEPMPEGAFIEHTITDETLVGEAISRAVAKTKTSLKDAAVAIGGAAVISKVINIDGQLNDSEMENQITVEADNFIPFDINEVMVDFELQEKMPSGLAEVLVAVCRTETIDSYETVLSFADLTARIVDVDLYVIERSITLLKKQIKDYDQKTIAIVDVGATITNINIFRHKKIIYTREQSFGGDILTEVIKQQCDVDTAEAVSIQKGTSLTKSVSDRFYEDFSRECTQQISQGLQFFNSSDTEAKIDLILLCGGAALTKGLKNHIETQLNTPCVIANPFEHMKLARKINKKLLQENAPAMMIACGLAMRSFD